MRIRARTSLSKKKNKAINRALAETLEPRTLLSLSPIGSEFHVNTYTPDYQQNASLAADGDGDFVIVWQSPQEGLNNTGIYAQRFNAAGAPQGGEIHVNINTAGAQNSPVVAMDPDGDFVVVWRDNVREGNNNGGIFARRFDAAGNPTTAEIHVNNLVDRDQSAPTVAMDAAGNFVVAFESLDPDTVPDIYARRFDFNGLPQGPQFLVNSTTDNYQNAPAIAMDLAGDFVITWESYLQDGSSYGIYARRYNSAGVVQSGEVAVNTTTSGHQMSPSIAMDGAGDYVIAFDNTNLAGTSYAIYAQRYSAAGAPQGGNFPASTFTTGRRFSSAAAMAANGGFMISWQSENQDGSGWGIFTQQFAPNGSPIGLELRVNTTALSNQQNVAIAADPTGDYVLTWHSYGQGGDPKDGIIAQRYHESAPDSVPPIVGGVFLNKKRILPYSSQLGPMQQLVVSFSENLGDTGGSSGATSVSNPANWILIRNGADITGAISSINYSYNPATNRFEVTLNFPASQPYTSGNFSLKLKDNVRDIAGNRLDGDFNMTAGGNFNFSFSLSAFVFHSGEAHVNTYTPNDQLAPAVAMDAMGNYVVIWYSYGQEPGFYGGAGVFGQRYSASGSPVGGEFHVNTTLDGEQSTPSVAMDPDGNFFVVWQSGIESQTIYGRRYNAAGIPQSGEIQISAASQGQQNGADIGMDASGDFVVSFFAFTQDEGTTYTDNVFAHRFNSAGVSQGSDVEANSTIPDHQYSAEIAVGPGGDFVVVWQSPSDGSSFGIFGQRFDSSGNELGGEFRANSYTTGDQTNPTIAMDAAGNFVIAWRSNGQDGSLGGIYAQRYNSAGIAQGGEFPVNFTTAADQSAPAIAMNSDGFLIAWHSDNQDGSGQGIYAQRYSPAGVAQGSEFLVNDTTANNQTDPNVVMNAAGQLVIAWSSIVNGAADVYVKRYSADLTPTVGSLADNPDPVTSGNTLTLSAANIVDDGTVASASFYRETNTEPGLQTGPGGDTLVGSTTTNNAGFWSANISTSGLAPGSYIYYAQATDDAGLTGSPASTISTVTPNASAPTLTASAFIYQTAPQRLTFRFDQDVHASLTSNSVTIQRLAPNPATIPVSAPTWDSATNTATFNFTAILPDGDYRATLNGSTINAGGPSMGSNPLIDFFFMLGDLNHDRTVSIADFIDLAAHFNQTPATYPEGDVNYDGSVSIADFIDLSGNFNKSLGTPPPSSAPAAASSLQITAASTTRKSAHHHRKTRRPASSPARSPVPVLSGLHAFFR